MECRASMGAAGVVCSALGDLLLSVGCYEEAQNRMSKAVSMSSYLC